MVVEGELIETRAYQEPVSGARKTIASPGEYGVAAVSEPAPGGRGRGPALGRGIVDVDQGVARAVEQLERGVDRRTVAQRIPVQAQDDHRTRPGP